MLLEHFRCFLIVAAMTMTSAMTEQDELPDEFLIVAETVSIRFLSLNGTEVASPIRGLRRAVGVDFDGETRTVFWTDTSEDALMLARMNGTGFRTIAKQLVIPSGVAYDPIGKHVYFSDSSLDIIGMATVDGQYVVNLVHTGLDEPRSIVLDPEGGFMYWVDLGSNAKIERAYMSGEKRQPLITEDLGWPNGLSLDVPKNQMYWVDGKTERLEFSRLDGSHRQQLLVFQENVHPFGMVMNDNMIYWTDRYTRRVYGIERPFGPSNKTFPLSDSLKVAETTSTPYGISLFSAKKATGTHACSENKGGCEQICLPEPSGKKCACSIGILSDNGLSCHTPNQFISIIVFQSIRSFVINDDNTLQPVATPITNLTKPLSVAIDPTTGYHYYTDITDKAIVEVKNNTKRVVVAGAPLSYPDNVAVDHVSKLLYYTDRGTNVVGMVSISGDWKRTLVDQLDEPRGLALDLKNGMVYWSDWGSKPLIERISMTGENRRELVTKGIMWPNGITLDVPNNKLYWVDARQDTVEVCDTDGSNRRLLGRFTGIHPYALAMYNEKLIWTDWQLSKLGSVPKDGGTITPIALPYASFRQPSGLAVYNASRVPETSACSDLENPCETDQVCLPNGTAEYVCVCIYGTYNPRTKECDRPSTFLLVTADNRISGVSRASTATNPIEVVSPVISDGAHGIDYHGPTKTIYWTQPKTGLILTSPLKPSERFTAPLNESLFMTQPRGIAVDWVSKLLYYTDWSNQSTIGVVSLDGTMQITLISDNLYKPAAIAVDPESGYMFWTDLGSTTYHARVEKAHMSGENRELFVPTNLVEEPTSIAVDRIGRMVYFCDASKDLLIGYSLSSNASRSFQVTSVDIHPFSLTAYNHSVYYADHKLKGVWWWQTTARGAKRIMRLNGTPMGITMYDEARIATKTTNMCAFNNGNCSQMCLAKPGGRLCGCTAWNNTGCLPSVVEGPRDVSVKVGQPITLQCLYGDVSKTGIPVMGVEWYHGSILLNQSEVLKIASARESDHGSYMCKVWNQYGSSSSKSATVRVRGGKFLLLGVGDEIRGIPKTAIASRPVIDVFNPIAAKKVYDVAYDAVNEYVYWSNNKDGGIYRRSLNANPSKEVKPWFSGKHVTKPTSIAVDWISRLLYYIDVHTLTIGAVSMDDTASHVIINSNLIEPSGLAVDPISGYMAWTEKGGDAKVEIAFMNGENRTVWKRKNVGNPSSVAIDWKSSYLYYADDQLDHISGGSLKGDLLPPRGFSVRHTNIHPFSIDVSADILYFADQNLRGLWQWKTGTALVNKMVSTLSNPSGVAMYDSSRKPGDGVHINQCISNNGGCPQICLAIPNGRQCACAEKNRSNCFPNFVQEPTGGQFPELTDVKLNCTFPSAADVGIPYLHGVWKRGSNSTYKSYFRNDLGKATAMFITIEKLEKSDEGDYWCELTNKYATTMSRKAVVKITPSSPPVTSLPSASSTQSSVFTSSSSTSSSSPKSSSAPTTSSSPPMSSHSSKSSSPSTTTKSTSSLPTSSLPTSSLPTSSFQKKSSPLPPSSSSEVVSSHTATSSPSSSKVKTSRPSLSSIPHDFGQPIIKKGGTNVAAIVAPIVVVLLIAAIAVAIILLYRRVRKPKESQPPSVEYKNDSFGFGYQEMSDGLGGGSVTLPVSGREERIDVKDPYAIPEDFGMNNDEEMLVT
eukprot:m.3350 g.3350  ORF g.3350 m.3350 type:complete len:1676 (+) comp9295_c0_seq1:160-5187(+)